jgi:hypothetical protein
VALNDAGLNVGGTAMATAYGFVSLHSGDPGVSGTSNVIAGGRFPIDIESTDGDLASTAAVAATGLTPLAEVAYLGLWSASTGGTFYGSAERISGDAAVNSAGEYTISSLTIPGASS